MGKRIIARARGKGGPRYRAPSWRYLGRVGYAPAGTGEIMDIVHDPGRSAPVCVVRVNQKKILQIAPHGIRVGDRIEYGGKEARVGNVLELRHIPVGTKVFGIESFPGSGPKFCRASGTFAIILGKTKKEVTVQFASGVVRAFNPRCRATIGVVAGAGRIEKPWVKAGKKHHALKARGKLFPRTRGVAMGPGEHPFGGGKKAHRFRTVSRRAPPGAKVGLIAPKKKR
jgi:large subunit ribosomal protein L2